MRGFVVRSALYSINSIGMFEAGSTNNSKRSSGSCNLRIEQETEASQTRSTLPPMIEWAPIHLVGCYRKQSAALVKTYLLLISCSLTLSFVTPFTITGKHCKQNVSVKYQVPVTHLSQTERHTANITTINDTAAPTATAESIKNYTYVSYEPRVRWEATNVCCPGYHALLFGFCEPICDMICPVFSYCATPNQCECLPGYMEHHPNNKEQQLLDCRPICVGGCPRHSHCVARNRCQCREGFRNVNTWWFMSLKCERIKCAASDQRYDVMQRTCVKIEMSMEDLMRKVAARLAKGVNDLDNGEDEEEEEEDEENERQVAGKENGTGRENMLETRIEGNMDKTNFV